MEKRMKSWWCVEVLNVKLSSFLVKTLEPSGYLSHTVVCQLQVIAIQNSCRLIFESE
jgi:hypothetical protein